MVDITRLQLNPIPESILMLQTTNKVLARKNSILTGILIIGCSITLAVIAEKIINHYKEENLIKIKKQLPRIK
jgi:hypothetical protein